MNLYEKMLEELREEGIILDETSLPNCEGFYRECPEYIYINVNGAMPLRKRIATLAHEAGHSKTMLIGTAGQIECRATKYAVKRVVPHARLLEAYCKGHETIHDLAEYFQVDEKFMRQVLLIYGILRDVGG